MRGAAPKYKEAKSNTPKPVWNISEIDGPQLIKFACVKGVIGAGKKLVDFVSKVDFLDTVNRVIVQATIVSNLENEKLLVPTAMNKEVEWNLAFWSSNLKHIEQLRKHVKNTSDSSETTAFNDDTNISSYQDYPAVKKLAQALKLEQRELSELPMNVRMIISKKMTCSRGNTSRFTRFVIAAFYEFCLLMKGGRTDITGMDTRPNDLIQCYNAVSLSAFAGRDDMAYVTCDRPQDSNYMGFLYIISREFPYLPAWSMLTHEVDGEEVYSNCLMNAITEEAPSIGIMCDGEPMWDGRESNFHFDAVTWHSFVVNYARSIGCEGYLDEAYAVAAVLMQPHLIPNVSLPSRRSAGELFSRCAATRSFHNPVPSMGHTRELLLGGACVASGCLAVYKEITSHDKMTSQGGTVNRTIITNIIKAKQDRDKWYRALGSQGFGQAAVVLDRIDFLDFDTGSAQLQYLDNQLITVHWGLSPYSPDREIAYGFLGNFKLCPYQTRLKLGTQTPENRAKTCGVLRQLGLIGGDRTKSNLVIESPRYRRRECRVLESWIHPGEMSVLKGGVKLSSFRFQNPTKPIRKKVIPPNEFGNIGKSKKEDDDDDDASCDSIGSGSAVSDYSESGSDELDDRPPAIKVIKHRYGSTRRSRKKKKVTADGRIAYVDEYNSYFSDIASLRDEASKSTIGSVDSAGKASDLPIGSIDSISADRINVSPVQELSKEESLSANSVSDGEGEDTGGAYDEVATGNNDPIEHNVDQECHEIDDWENNDVDDALDNALDAGQYHGHIQSDGALLWLDITIDSENEMPYRIINKIFSMFRTEIGVNENYHSEDHSLTRNKAEYDMRLIGVELEYVRKRMSQGLSSDKILELLDKRQGDRAFDKENEGNKNRLSSGEIAQRSRAVREKLDNIVKDKTYGVSGSLPDYSNDWMNRVADALKNTGDLPGEKRTEKVRGIGDSWPRLRGVVWSPQRRDILHECILKCEDAGAEVFTHMANHVGINSISVFKIYKSVAFQSMLSGNGYTGVGKYQTSITRREAEIFRRMVGLVNRNFKCEYDNKHGENYRGPLVSMSVEQIASWLRYSSRRDSEKVRGFSTANKRARELIDILRACLGNISFSEN
jgi:hypothetical protein